MFKEFYDLDDLQVVDGVAQDETVGLQPLEQRLDVQSIPIRKHFALDAQRTIFQSSFTVCFAPQPLEKDCQQGVGGAQ